ncbi:ras-related Rab-10 [Brachionus plicatilis]|uniref:Ras-related protein Rab-1 n=1 Tax=Brachionus plicatilis TaxID=10195 RepID=A0A3M7T623_BRAPC|nr:ras-related Rab-10 [Brachionus plicatilis]
MSQRSYDHFFKVLLIGESSVGKSSIILRYTDNSFDENFVSTIGIDFKIKTLEIQGKTIKLQIWDTAGQERFHSVTYSFYRGAHAILLVYDITQARSFSSLATWLRNIEQYLYLFQHAENDTLKYIVGNKCDCTELRVVQKKEGEQIAEKFMAEFFETSAKMNTNIDSLFKNICYKILAKKQSEKSNKSEDLTGQNDQNSYSVDSLLMYTNSSINRMSSNCC